jgi:DNA-binding response OmpR family regulator
MQKKVLIVEDDAAIRRGLVDAISFAGYTALEAQDAARGMDMAVKMDFDLLLLDLVLPHGDGFEILKKVRQVRPTLPVIILTARGEETDRVKGLHLGADDYVVKPFSIKELLARVEAVLRRSPGRPTDVENLAVPGGEVDFSRCEIRFADGEHIELSEREMELLRYLAQNAGRVVSREEILSNVWRINPRGVYETRTIDMHIARLREKLRDNPDNPQVILTVRGTGYKFGMKEDSL